jgi:uncharacterized membrane protein
MLMIGPVQIVVLGFERPRFVGRMREELTRLREEGLIRLADAMVVHKDSRGETSVIHTSDLTTEAAREYGAIIGGLIGLGAAEEVGAWEGARLGARMFSDANVHLLDLAPAEVLETIPNDSEAVVLLVEHRWVMPLQEAIREEGGFPLFDAWIRAEDLVAMGYLVGSDA